jgi:cytochrome P450
MLAIPSFLRESSPFFLAVILSGTYLLYALLCRAVTAYQRSVIRRANGCKSIPAFPHKDPVFGLDFFVEGSRLIKTGGFLARTVERFECVNGGVNTYSQIVLGTRVIVTREPENIKAILATKFKEFGLTYRRMNAFTPLLGHGIFTSDGKQWEASRALLRPSFARSLIGDLEVFEGHVSRMMDWIPQDGSTVDLQELFFMLTLDSGNLKARASVGDGC